MSGYTPELEYSLEPYDGTENYIFISYPHAEKERVYPIIKELMDHGFNVWFDKGIENGNEWPAVIASHLKRSSIVIFMMCESFLRSSNCRNELNYAAKYQKDYFGIFLDDVPFDGPEDDGVELQMISKHNIMMFSYPSPQMFYDVLLGNGTLLSCRSKDTDEEAEPARERPVPPPPTPRPAPQPASQPASDSGQVPFESQPSLTLIYDVFGNGKVILFSPKTRDASYPSYGRIDEQWWNRFVRASRDMLSAAMGISDFGVKLMPASPFGMYPCAPMGSPQPMEPVFQFKFQLTPRPPRMFSKIKAPHCVHIMVGRNISMVYGDKNRKNLLAPKDELVDLGADTQKLTTAAAKLYQLANPGLTPGNAGFIKCRFPEQGNIMGFIYDPNSIGGPG